MPLIERNIQKAIWLLMLILVGLGGGDAWAEASGEADEEDAASTARARALFREGLQFSDQNRWEEAAERFQTALALRDAPTIRYNLGTSLIQLERLVEAANQLETARHHPEAQPELQEQAQEQLAALEPQLGRIEIVLEEFEEPPRVVVDGTLLRTEQLTHQLWVDPGHHVATAEQDGSEVARVEVDIVAGSLESVNLRPLPHEVVTDENGHDDGTPLIRDWRLWLGVGCGVAVLALAFGLGFGLSGDLEDPVMGNMDPGVIEWP